MTTLPLEDHYRLNLHFLNEDCLPALGITEALPIGRLLLNIGGPRPHRGPLAWTVVAKMVQVPII